MPAGLARCVPLLTSRSPAAVAYAGSQLATIVTRDDWPAAEAVPLARALASALGQAGERARARIILILGVLAERAPGARDAAREYLDSYLDLLAAALCGSPEYLALLYLLAHFPPDRTCILEAAGKHAVADPHGISRLDRTLLQLDLADPETVNAAGRSWPSPAFLAVTEEEMDSTAAARRAQPAMQVRASWAADTAALLAYAGGLAAAGCA